MSIGSTSLCPNDQCDDTRVSLRPLNFTFLFWGSVTLWGLVVFSWRSTFEVGCDPQRDGAAPWAPPPWSVAQTSLDAGVRQLEQMMWALSQEVTRLVQQFFVDYAWWMNVDTHFIEARRGWWWAELIHHLDMNWWFSICWSLCRWCATQPDPTWWLTF